MSRAASGDVGGGVGFEEAGTAEAQPGVRRAALVQEAEAGLAGRFGKASRSSGAASGERAAIATAPGTTEGALAAKVVSPFKARKVLGLRSLSCGSQSITGAASTTCTLTTGSAAPSGGLVVTLNSDDAALSVPGSVTMAGGASRVTFVATAAAVSTTQMANIKADAGGSTASVAIQLNAYVPALSFSSTTVAFGPVVVGQTAANTVTLTSSGSAPLTISSISVAGSLFKATGVNMPLTLNPGQTAVLALQFYADHTSSYTGIVTISSNAAQGAATVRMSADGVPALSGLTYNTASFAAAGTDSCVATLVGTAASGGFAISLGSSNASVAVPASVTVAPGEMSASFSATVNGVSTAQTATLTATAGAMTKSFALQLEPGSAVLTANAASVPFGSVLINAPAEQSITLTASGSAPVTISSVAVTGAGFAQSGLGAPVTLNPGQTTVVNVQFTPTTSGAFSGELTIGSNATGGTLCIGLSGTGYGHSVQLSWSAPSSTGVVGYNVYRAASGTTVYQRVNAGAVSSTTYADGSINSGTSYAYYVTSLDGSGRESVPSNTTTVGIPTP